MNKQQIIDAAMQLAAGQGGDPITSPVIDGDMTMEDLLPLAIRHAYKVLVNSGEMRLQDVLVTHGLSLTSAAPFRVGGRAPLPYGVLTEYLDHAFIPEYPFSAYMPVVPDFDRARYDAMLCYWTVDGNYIYTTCGIGLNPDPGPGLLTIISLRAPSVPVIPASPTTEVVMTEAARDAVIMTLAKALRGEMQLIQ